VLELMNRVADSHDPRRPELERLQDLRA
jgi:hypothetical protein